MGFRKCPIWELRGGHFTPGEKCGPATKSRKDSEIEGRGRVVGCYLC